MLSFVWGLDALSDGPLVVKEASWCWKPRIFTANIGLKNLTLNINLPVGMERPYDSDNGGKRSPQFFCPKNTYVLGNSEYDEKRNKYSKE